MKNGKLRIHSRGLVFLLGMAAAAVLLIAACDGITTPLGAPQTQEGYGTLIVDLGTDAARTTRPDIVVAGSGTIKKVAFKFTRSSDGYVREFELTSGFEDPVVLPVIGPYSTYNIEVVAYANDGNAQPTVELANWEGTVDIYLNTITTVTAKLSPTGTDKGTFTYNITYGSASLSVSLESLDNNKGPISLSASVAASGSELSPAVALDPGSYRFTARAITATTSGGITEVIHIYPNQKTTFTYDFSGSMNTIADANEARRILQESLVSMVPVGVLASRVDHEPGPAYSGSTLYYFGYKVSSSLFTLSASTGWTDASSGLTLTAGDKTGEKVVELTHSSLQEGTPAAYAKFTLKLVPVAEFVVDFDGGAIPASAVSFPAAATLDGSAKSFSKSTGGGSVICKVATSAAVTLTSADITLSDDDGATWAIVNRTDTTASLASFSMKYLLKVHLNKEAQNAAAVANISTLSYFRTLVDDTLLSVAAGTAGIAQTATPTATAVGYNVYFIGAEAGAGKNLLANLKDGWEIKTGGTGSVSSSSATDTALTLDFKNTLNQALSAAGSGYDTLVVTANLIPVAEFTVEFTDDAKLTSIPGRTAAINRKVTFSNALVTPASSFDYLVSTPASTKTVVKVTGTDSNKFAIADALATAYSRNPAPTDANPEYGTAGNKKTLTLSGSDYTFTLGSDRYRIWVYPSENDQIAIAKDNLRQVVFSSETERAKWFTSATKDNISKAWPIQWNGWDADGDEAWAPTPLPFAQVDNTMLFYVGTVPALNSATFDDYYKDTAWTFVTTLETSDPLGDHYPVKYLATGDGATTPAQEIYRIYMVATNDFEVDTSLLLSQGATKGAVTVGTSGDQFPRDGNTATTQYCARDKGETPFTITVSNDASAVLKKDNYVITIGKWNTTNSVYDDITSTAALTSIVNATNVTTYTFAAALGSDRYQIKVYPSVQYQDKTATDLITGKTGKTFVNEGWFDANSANVYDVFCPDPTTDKTAYTVQHFGTQPSMSTLNVAKTTYPHSTSPANTDPWYVDSTTPTAPKIVFTATGRTADYPDTGATQPKFTFTMTPVVKYTIQYANDDVAAGKGTVTIVDNGGTTADLAPTSPVSGGSTAIAKPSANVIFTSTTNAIQVLQGDGTTNVAKSTNTTGTYSATHSTPATNAFIVKLFDTQPKQEAAAYKIVSDNLGTWITDGRKVDVRQEKDANGDDKPDVSIVRVVETSALSSTALTVNTTALTDAKWAVDSASTATAWKQNTGLEYTLSGLVSGVSDVKAAYTVKLESVAQYNVTYGAGVTGTLTIQVGTAGDDNPPLLVRTTPTSGVTQTVYGAIYNNTDAGTIAATTTHITFSTTNPAYKVLIDGIEGSDNNLHATSKVYTIRVIAE